MNKKLKVGDRIYQAYFIMSEDEIQTFDVAEIAVTNIEEDGAYSLSDDSFIFPREIDNIYGDELADGTYLYYCHSTNKEYAIKTMREKAKRVLQERIDKLTNFLEMIDAWEVE